MKKLKMLMDFQDLKKDQIVSMGELVNAIEKDPIEYFSLIMQRTPVVAATDEVSDTCSCYACQLRRKVKAQTTKVKEPLVEQKKPSIYIPKSLVRNLETVEAGTMLYGIRLSDMASGAIMYDPKLKPDEKDHHLFTDRKERDNVYAMMQQPDFIMDTAAPFGDYTFTGEEIDKAYADLAINKITIDFEELKKQLLFNKVKI